MSNAYEQIMKQLSVDSEIVSEKTAAETPAPTRDKVASAVSELVAPAKSAPSAVSAELAEVAKTAAAADTERMTKQAQEYGRVMADGFMARMSEYNTAFEAGEKTAQIKVAQEVASGQEDALQEIFKTASDLHYQGQVVADKLISDILASADA